MCARKLMFLFITLFGGIWVPTVWATKVMVPIVAPSPPALGVKSYVLMDARTGQILAQKDPNLRISPGSITKLMTAYIVFEEIYAGHLSLGQQFRVTKTAWDQPGSRMFLQVGSMVTVRNLLAGMLVDGGNDAAVVLAQNIAGTRQSFVDLMNEYAHILKLKKTHFSSVTGLKSQDNYTTALDVAKLARDIVLYFPQYRSIFSLKRFTWNHITQFNFNKTLWRDSSAWGLEPGYSSSKRGGFSLAETATQQHMTLIAIVMGMPKIEGETLIQNLDALARTADALIDFGFQFYELRQLYPARKILGMVSVHNGQERHLPYGLKKSFDIIIPRGTFSDLHAKATFSYNLSAPLLKGQSIGTMHVLLGSRQIGQAPLVSLSHDPKIKGWQLIEFKLKSWLEKI